MVDKTISMELGVTKQTGRWMLIGEIKKGQKVSWWTSPVEVLEVIPIGNSYEIKVFDNHEGKEVSFLYKDTDELFVVD